MFPTIQAWTVKRGTSEVSFLTTAEANEALPDVPTDVFTNRFVQVDWARKQLGLLHADEGRDSLQRVKSSTLILT